MKKRLLFTMILAMSVNAFASTIFQCTTTHGKELKLSENGNKLTYQFGKVGKPELSFNVNKWDAHYDGGESAYYIIMPYQGKTFTVFHSHVEVSTPKIEAGVIVNWQRRNQVRILCNPKQIKINQLNSLGVPS